MLDIFSYTYLFAICIDPQRVAAQDFVLLLFLFLAVGPHPAGLREPYGAKHWTQASHMQSRHLACCTIFPTHSSTKKHGLVYCDSILPNSAEFFVCLFLLFVRLYKLLILMMFQFQNPSFIFFAFYLLPQLQKSAPKNNYPLVWTMSHRRI